MVISSSPICALPNPVRKAIPKWLKDRIRLWHHRSRIAARYYFLPHSKSVPVIVLATPRCGSTFLVDSLGSHEHVSHFPPSSEVLLDFADFPEWPYGLPVGRVGKDRPLRHIAYSLNWLQNRFALVKILLDQLPQHALTVADLAARFPTAKYLVLYRASLLEQYVSFKLAVQTNEWQRTKPTKRRTRTVHIDAEEFAMLAQWLEDLYGEALSHPLIRRQGLLLQYEDLRDDSARVLKKTVAPFLGLTAIDFSTTLVKQNTRDLADVVENYAEIEDAVSQYSTLELDWPDSA